MKNRQLRSQRPPKSVRWSVRGLTAGDGLFNENDSETEKQNSIYFSLTLNYMPLEIVQ